MTVNARGLSSVVVRSAGPLLSCRARVLGRCRLRLRRRGPPDRRASFHRRQLPRSTARGQRAGLAFRRLSVPRLCYWRTTFDAPQPPCGN